MNRGEEAFVNNSEMRLIHAEGLFQIHACAEGGAIGVQNDGPHAAIGVGLVESHPQGLCKAPD